MKIKTYIMHYSKLHDRKLSIKSELDKQNIQDYDFILSYDKEDLDNTIISNFYKDDAEIAGKYANISLKRLPNTKYKHDSLQKSSLSLCIKHYKALSFFIDSSYDHAMILEDDCIFNQKVSIEDIISKAPSNWDILFIGGVFDKSIYCDNATDDNYILSDHPSTNTTVAMIYNKKSAKHTLENILPFYLPIDWHLNYIFNKCAFNVYHLNPYVCTQSKLFQSSIIR